VLKKHFDKLQITKILNLINNIFSQINLALFSVDTNVKLVSLIPRHIQLFNFDCEVGIEDVVPFGSLIGVMILCKVVKAFVIFLVLL